MGMFGGFLGKVTTGLLGKKILSGASKALKSIGRGVSKVAKSAAHTVKRAWKTRLGKVLITAAVLYAGGWAIGAFAAPSMLANGLIASDGILAGSPIISGIVQGAAVGAVGGAATGKDSNILKGAALGGAMGGAGAYMSAPAAGSATANAGSAMTPQVGNAANAAIDLPAAAPVSAGDAAMAAADTAAASAPAAAPTLGSGLLSNPTLQTAGLMMGGQALSGYAQGKSQEKINNQNIALAREQFNRSQLDGTGLGIQATVNGQPANGQYWQPPAQQVASNQFQQSILQQNAQNTGGAGLLTPLANTPLGQPIGQGVI